MLRDIKKLFINYKLNNMKMLIIIGYVAFATLSVFSLVNMLRQINKMKDD